MRTSPCLKAILRATLAAGNYLNHGTRNGNAFGFRWALASGPPACALCSHLMVVERLLPWLPRLSSHLTQCLVSYARITPLNRNVMKKECWLCI